MPRPPDAHLRDPHPHAGDDPLIVADASRDPERCGALAPSYRRVGPPPGALAFIAPPCASRPSTAPRPRDPRALRVLVGGPTATMAARSGGRGSRAALATA